MAERIEPTSRIVSEIKLITPDLAREYLGNQVKNRKWRRDMIDRYKSEMLNGTWYLNGQPIIFDDKNRLIDGQHRLMAVIESNRSVDMVVTSGIATGLEKTIDSGKSRTMGDVFQMNGVRNARLLSRTSKLLLVWEEKFYEIVKKQGFTKDLMNVHPLRVFDFYMAHKIDIDRACNDFKKNTEIITRTGAAVLSFVFAVLEEIDLERCYAFITSYTSGNIKKEWPYLLKIRSEFMDRVPSDKIRVTEAERISILFGAWNITYHGARTEDVEQTILNIPRELTNP